MGARPGRGDRPGLPARAAGIRGRHAAVGRARRRPDHAVRAGLELAAVRPVPLSRRRLTTSISRRSGMARQGSTLKVSYEELLKLPDDGLRHELIGGEHYVTACPIPWHQLIATRVVISLGAFAAAAECGQVLYPVDVVLSPHDVVEPDVLFLSREHVDRIRGKFLTEPPDLVIEILSPSPRGRDLGVKLRLYERFGVPEYWVLDPAAATARVFLHGPRGYGEGMLLSAARGDSLTTLFAPGWGLPLCDLFR